MRTTLTLAEDVAATLKAEGPSGEA